MMRFFALFFFQDPPIGAAVPAFYFSAGGIYPVSCIKVVEEYLCLGFPIINSGVCTLGEEISLDFFKRWGRW